MAYSSHPEVLDQFVVDLITILNIGLMSSLMWMRVALQQVLDEVRLWTRSANLSVIKEDDGTDSENEIDVDFGSDSKRQEGVQAPTSARRGDTGKKPARSLSDDLVLNFHVTMFDAPSGSSDALAGPILLGDEGEGEGEGGEAEGPHSKLFAVGLSSHMVSLYSDIGPAGIAMDLPLSDAHAHNPTASTFTAAVALTMRRANFLSEPLSLRCALQCLCPIDNVVSLSIQALAKIPHRRERPVRRERDRDGGGGGGGGGVISLKLANQIEMAIVENSEAALPIAHEVSRSGAYVVCPGRAFHVTLISGPPARGRDASQSVDAECARHHQGIRILNSAPRRVLVIKDFESFPSEATPL